MATIFIQFNAAYGAYAAGTTVQTDSAYEPAVELLSADLATQVANPGGTVPVFGPGPRLTAGAQATAVTANAEGAGDRAGSVTFTALASGMAAGVLGTVGFSAALPAVPRAILLADRSTSVLGLYVSAKSATGFTISCKAAASASQAIPVDYVVVL